MSSLRLGAADDRTRDWTNGCIALSDEDLQELWDLTAGQTPVEIVP
jgi:L,D-transpeptidase catalytic domain